MKYGWDIQYDILYRTFLLLDHPKGGMFCRVCQKSGTPPPSASLKKKKRGIMDWNHATEMLKQHNTSQWHRDAVLAPTMDE